MEQYIKNNLSDITYKSELTPAPSKIFWIISAGVNSPKQLTSLAFRKLRAH